MQSSRVMPARGRIVCPSQDGVHPVGRRHADADRAQAVVGAVRELLDERAGGVRAAHDEHLGRLFAVKLPQLDESQPQQRIEQHGQYEDHEQRAPVAQLIADLALENEQYV